MKHEAAGELVELVLMGDGADNVSHSYLLTADNTQSRCLSRLKGYTSPIRSMGEDLEVLCRICSPLLKQRGRSSSLA